MANDKGELEWHCYLILRSKFTTFMCDKSRGSRLKYNRSVWRQLDPLCFVRASVATSVITKVRSLQIPFPASTSLSHSTRPIQTSFSKLAVHALAKTCSRC